VELVIDLSGFGVWLKSLRAQVMRCTAKVAVKIRAGTQSHIKDASAKGP
jgi:hypothetical protein